MKTAQIILILSTVLLLAIGQVLFKIAAVHIEKNALPLLAAIFSPQLIFALSVYAIATLMWIYSLRTTPLQIAYPFVAFAFILVPMLGHWFLNERIGINTVIGAVLIMLGVVVSVYK